MPPAPRPATEQYLEPRTRIGAARFDQPHELVKFLALGVAAALRFLCPSASHCQQGTDRPDRSNS